MFILTPTLRFLTANTANIRGKNAARMRFLCASLTLATLIACNNNKTETETLPPPQEAIEVQTPVEAITKESTNIAQNEEEGVSKELQNILEIYKYLHANPELSLLENKTADYLAQKLTALGFEVTQGVGGTGVVAVLENGEGKTLLIRADMDALPVKEQTNLDYASTIEMANAQGKVQPVMHACGHDIHMSVALGVAQRLATQKNTWRGRLLIVMQPAEEVGKGAKMMIEDGLFVRFARPDYNLALHTNSHLAAGEVGIVSGYALANVDSVNIHIHGVGGHGAYPQATKDPIILAAQIVMALQTIISREISPLDPAVITVGSIHGGHKHNIISDKVVLQLTLRSYSEKVRAQTIAAILRITEGLGRAAGMPEDKLPEVEVLDEFTPASFNDPKLAARVQANLTAKMGKERVLSLDPVMGGEDFGRFGQLEPKIPSLIFWLGAVTPEKMQNFREGYITLPSLHSPFFAPDPLPTLQTGIEAMHMSALDLFED